MNSYGVTLDNGGGQHPQTTRGTCQCCTAAQRPLQCAAQPRNSSRSLRRFCRDWHQQLRSLDASCCYCATSTTAVLQAMAWVKCSVQNRAGSVLRINWPSLQCQGSVTESQAACPCLQQQSCCVATLCVAAMATTLAATAAEKQLLAFFSSTTAYDCISKPVPAAQTSNAAVVPSICNAAGPQQ